MSDHGNAIRDAALAAAARLGVSDEHLIALMWPNGYECYYGSSDCETCGYNTDEVTWYFHGPNKVSWEGRWGCYSGDTGGPATFDEALRHVPSFGEWSRDEHGGGQDLDRAHLEALWAECKAELGKIKADAS